MSLPLRLGLYYAAVFAGTGVASPYAPLWFAQQGLSGAQIGLILSLPMVARTLTAPLLAIWADSFKLRRTPLAIMGVVVAASYALMAAPMGFGGWAVAWFVASSTFSTLSPLTDVIVLRRARRDGFNYGWPRGLGSLAFVIANLAMGAILTWGSPDLVLVWLATAAGSAALAARLLLPPDPVHEGGVTSAASGRFAGVGELIRDPGFMTAVIAAGLIQSAHAFYYGFSTLSWKQQGFPEGVTGILWAIGVAAEVVFLWFLEPWRRRIGPRKMLLLGGIAAVVRWTALAFSPPLWAVLPLQALHVFSFAATFMATLQIVEAFSTPRNASAAQAISSALSGGMLMGLATLASGPLFDRFGAQGYLLMSAMALAGLAGAAGLYRVRRLDPP